MSEIDELLNELNIFIDERDWRKFHNPKDLAISISLEASELLENFQWKSSEESLKSNFKNIKEEIADVMIYSLMLCSYLDLNPKEIIQEKNQKNSRKYPIDSNSERTL